MEDLVMGPDGGGQRSDVGRNALQEGIHRGPASPCEAGAKSPVLGPGSPAWVPLSERSATSPSLS